MISAIFPTSTRPLHKPTILDYLVLKPQPQPVQVEAAWGLAS